MTRLQRSDGACRVSLGPSPGGARIASLYQSDPCRFFLPPADRGDLPCGLLLTTSGGIAGGDRLRLDLAWEADARATITTGAAEKIYRAGTSGPAQIETRLAIGPNAYAEFLPQETILFRQSRLERRCHIDLGVGGRLLIADMVVLGRIASGERYEQALLRDRWEIHRDNRLVFFDALRLDTEDERPLDHPAGMAGARAFGLVLLAAPEAQDLAAAARAALPEEGLCGVTVINDILVARWLMPDGASLKRHVGRMAATLRASYGLPPRAPRVWQ